MQIRPKLVSLLILVGFIPLLISGIVGAIITVKILQDQTIDHLSGIAGDEIARISQSFEVRQSAFSELMQRRNFRKFILDYQNKRSPQIKHILETSLEDLKTTFRSYTEVLFVNPDGRILFSADPKDEGRLVADQRWFQNAQLDQISFVDLDSRNHPSLVFAMPMTEKGILKGIFMARSKISVITDVDFAARGLGKTGAVGMAIENDHRQAVFINYDSFRNPTSEPPVFDIANSDLPIAHALRKEEKVFDTEDSKHEKVFAASRYFAPLKIGLVVKIDKREALLPIRFFLEVKGWLLFASLLFTALAAALFSRSVRRPLQLLEQGTRMLSAGKFSHRIETHGDDEIAHLSRSFNQMMEDLERVTVSRDALEHEVKEREKAEDALRDKNKDLERINLELDSFVYIASHDLRAPLRAIGSFASFLEQDCHERLGAEGQEFVQQIRTGVDRMTRLIDDLLTLSRISRIHNPYEEVNMQTLLESVIERLQFDLDLKDVRLSIQKDLPVVFCDRIKMAEVFVNLISNSIKFSPKLDGRSPQVEVGCQKSADHFTFFVKDNGIGIDPKYHQQIFKLFSRLHTQEEYEGTGAGLNIVKRVVEEHQGRMWVESAVGSGASFFVEIPAYLKGVGHESRQSMAERA